MTKFKPFTSTEMKILIFNKVKRGMTYDQACKELEGEISECIKNSKTKKEKPSFKEEFEKLKDGQKR